MSIKTAGIGKHMERISASKILCFNEGAGRLGEGSYGVVHCAYHEDLNWIAVKCFAVEDPGREQLAADKYVSCNSC